MDNSQAADNAPNHTAKRGPLDNLSHDDLLKKCKGLLGIAQKAKQAKDEFAEENKQLKEKINKYEMQKAADKDGLQAMQEIVELLTQQKLAAATTIDNISTKTSALEKLNNEIVLKLNSYEQQLSDLDTENSSFKRQNARLTKENEELLNEMDNLERKCTEFENVEIQHKNILLSLEGKLQKIQSENQALQNDKILISQELTKIKNGVEIKNQETLKTLGEIEKNGQHTAESINSKLITNLKFEIKARNEEIEKLQQHLEMNKLEIEMNSKLLNSKSAVAEFQDSLADSEKSSDLHLKNNEIGALQKQVEQLKQEIKDKQLLIDHLTQQVMTLELKNYELASDSENISSLKMDVEYKDKEIETLKHELDIFYSNKNTTEKMVGDLKSELDNKSCDLLKCQSDVQENLKTISDLQQQLGSLSVEIEFKSGKILTLESEIQKKHAELLSLNEQIVSLKQELDNASVTIGVLQNNKLETARIVNKETEQNEQLEYEETQKVKEQLAQCQQYICDLELKLKHSDARNDMSNDLKNKPEITVEQLNDDPGEKNKQFIENQNLVSKLTQDLSDSSSKYDELYKKYSEVKSSKDRLNAKLKIYRDKLVEFASNLKNLKATKIVLLETVKEYSLNIPKWQREISNISSLMCKKLLNLENENKELKSTINILEGERNNLMESNENNLDLVENIQSLESDNKALCDEIHNINDKFKELLQSKLENLEIEKQSLNSLNEELLVKLQLLSKDNFVLTEKIQKLTEEKETLLMVSSDNERLVNEMDNMNSQIEKLKLENKRLLQNVEEINFDNTTAEEKFGNVQEDLELLKKELDSANQELCQYKKDNSELLVNVKHLSLKAKQLEQLSLENEDLQTKCHNFKSENIELLGEMKEMNEALKERGETISKQQEYGAEMERKIQLLESEVNELKCLLANKESELFERRQNHEQAVRTHQDLMDLMNSKVRDNEEVIRTLQGELDKSKDRLNSTLDTQSEVMSTSTYSKVDENASLKELDSSFEERYAKLRILAVKLKKKVSDQATQIALLEAENSKVVAERNDIQTKINAMSTQAKNYHNLQLEYDKLQDELEEQKSQIKLSGKSTLLLQQEIDKTKSEFVALTERNNKLDKELENIRKEKITLEMAVKEFQNQIHNLKKENEGELIVRKQKDDEINILKNELTVKEKSLAAEKDAMKLLKQELDKTKQEIKKKSVLSLEMDDYEKTLNELSQKLEVKKGLILELGTTISTNSNTISALNEQIKLLEESLKSEENHSKELKEKLNSTLLKIGESEKQNSQRGSQIDGLKHEIELLSSKMEELSTELAKCIAERDKTLASCKNEKEIFLHQVYGLEEQVTMLTRSLSDREQELSDVKAEFVSYKVRAQSVLRQNQVKDTGFEEELQQENIALTASINSLNHKYNTVSAQLETLTKDYNVLQDEKQRSVGRCNELVSLLENLRLEHEMLLESHRKQAMEHQEILKAQKLQSETLTSCYKQQIADIEDKYVQELAHLKSITESQKDKESVPDYRSKPAKKLGNVGFNFVPLAPEESRRIDMTMIEREEGEGSESTHSISPSSAPLRRTSNPSRKAHDLIPLDELLNSSGADIEVAQIMSEEYTKRTVSPSTELEDTKRKLSLQETRAKHLTGLLTETEQDLARLTQLNEVLKEEVRRHQRSLEREKHAQNSEYLKNVVFKFVTLGSGDEKTHLVPVLNTILKLSPEETQKLQAVASGIDPASGGKGWGSYLPHWSNSQ